VVKKVRADKLITALVLGTIFLWTGPPELVRAAPEQKSAPGTYISGQVSAGDNGPITGLVVIEKGRLYGKDFRYGGLIDTDGKFSVRVDGGGSYGLHLYATGYIYFPLSIEVVEGQDNHSTYSLPPNAAAADGPTVADIRFEKVDDETLISLSASDPDSNLSHQVLAVNTTTGEGFRLKPPGLVFPWTRNYPNGIYSLRYSRADNSGEKGTNPENWYFVAADNRCYTSPILTHPFTRESVLAARTSLTVNNSPGKGGTGDTHKEPMVLGAEVYRNNCSICHYADSTKAKVGPGLKGIFKLKTAPVQGFPVNDPSIRKQIIKGGAGMPPYEHLSDAEVDALIVFLKTL
jgi:mono/diheme cytochrome c family protein